MIMRSKAGTWGWETRKGKLSLPVVLLIVTTMIALLLGGMLATLSPVVGAFVIGSLGLAVIIALRQDELAVTAVMVIRLYVDWYLGLALVAQVVTIILLAIFFLSRTPQRPWAEPHALWLWILLLVVALFPALRGVTLLDEIYYYSNVVFSALIIFWLGTVVARDVASVQRLLKLLSCFSTFVAVVTIIQATTGALWFGTTHYNQYIMSIGDYAIDAGADIYRVGSFFVNPNSGGAFFAMMLLIPLGLFVKSPSFPEKILYLVEIFIMLLALLFTYSANSFLSTCIGAVVFVALVGRNSYRILMPLIILGLAIIMIVVFPLQTALLLQHAQEPTERALRIIAWQSGIQVIRAFPLTGLGLGQHVFLERAQPYNLIALNKPLDHPHNSFLELAALGGLPLGIVFTALLSFTFWLAFRNWIRADIQTRPLLAGGIASAIALSCYSLIDAGWTLAPLLAMGWLMLGVVSSSPLRKNCNREMLEQEK